MKKYVSLAIGLLLSSAMLGGCSQNCPVQETASVCVESAPVADAVKIQDEEKPATKENTQEEIKEGSVIPETNDMQEVYAFLKETQTYYIATVEGDQPRVRPFGTVNIYDGKLYFQTGKKKNVAHQIDANHKIEICAFDGKRWLRLAGEAIEDERVEAQVSMLDSYPHLKSMYQAGDGNTVVYYLKDATATFSSFAAAERVIHF